MCAPLVHRFHSRDSHESAGDQPLKRACGVGIAERFTWVAAGAAHYGVSWAVAHRAYVRTRRTRWRLAADRWHTAIVHAAGTARLLGHVDGRTSAKVAEWLQQQSDSWRTAVTHVTIDLSAAYLN